MAGWKKDPTWRWDFPIEHGDFPPQTVSLPAANNIISPRVFKKQNGQANDSSQAAVPVSGLRFEDAIWSETKPIGASHL